MLMQFVINYIVGFGSVFHRKLSSFVSVWLKDKISGFIFERECLRTHKYVWILLKFCLGYFFLGYTFYRMKILNLKTMSDVIVGHQPRTSPVVHCMAV